MAPAWSSGLSCQQRLQPRALPGQLWSHSLDTLATPLSTNLAAKSPPGNQCTKPQIASWLANHTGSAPDRRVPELLPPWVLLGSQTENKAGIVTKAALLQERDALLSSDGSGG